MKQESLLPAREARLILMIWFVVVLFLPWNSGDLPAPGTLVDPDSYMRLIEVERLWNGASWFDHVNDRMNAPEGLLVHWTRPVDLILIGLSLPFMPFMDAGQALYLAGYLISPVFLLLTGLMVYAGASAVRQPHAGLLASAMLFFPSSAAIYGMPGHADHHTILLFLTALAAVQMLRLQASGYQEWRARKLGWTLGLGLWISPEFLIVVAPLLAGMLMQWLVVSQDRALNMRGIARSFLVVTGVGFLSIGGFDEGTSPSYDRISLAHVWLALLHWVMWEVIARRPVCEGMAARMIVPGISALMLFAGIMLWFPGFFEGPAYHVPAEGQALWLGSVSEMKGHSLTSVEGWREFLGLHSSMTFIALGLVIWLVCYRKLELRLWPLALVLVFVSIMGVMHLRLTQYSIPLACMLVAPWGRDVLAWLGRDGIRSGKRALAGLAVLLALFGPPSAGYLLSIHVDSDTATDPGDAPTGTASARCLAPEVLAALAAEATDGPDIVMANVDIGPELVWLTAHSAVAGPYHRGYGGIIDSIKVFGGASSREAADIIRNREAGLLLYCPARGTGVWQGHDTGGEALFVSLLKTGDVPAWLAPVHVETGDQVAGQLYRINQAALSSFLNM